MTAQQHDNRCGLCGKPMWPGEMVIADEDGDFVHAECDAQHYEQMLYDRDMGDS